MTEIAQMLDTLKRIEVHLAAMEGLLVDIEALLVSFAKAIETVTVENLTLEANPRPWPRADKEPEA
jgi:hypothetical protein